MKITLCLLLCVLCGCVQIPEGVPAVKGFDLSRYLGNWYEIARLDHFFERGLTHVTATYSLNPDGSVRIVNRGFAPEENRWKQAEGRAYFVSTPDIGRLKVSFFGPFYGGYNIIDLDERDYSYVLICGNNKSYLWILARQPVLPEAAIVALTRKAKSLGFDTAALIFVRQDSSGSPDAPPAPAPVPALAPEALQPAAAAVAAPTDVTLPAVPADTGMKPPIPVAATPDTPPNAPGTAPRPASPRKLPPFRHITDTEFQKSGPLPQSLQNRQR